MRILVQQKETGLYLSDEGGWTQAGTGQAIDFTSSNAAIDFCLAHKLMGVQLVLKFEGQSHDIVLPLVPLPAEAPVRSAGRGADLRRS